VSGLEIPERAWRAFDAEPLAGNNLEAAAPIIVADRLRKLADDYQRRADQIDVSTAVGPFVRNAFARGAELARADADELDPGGVT
jgi:hypothetical protein